MQFQEYYHYNKDTDTLLSMFIDENYHVQRAKKLGALHFEIVELKKTDELFHLNSKEETPLTFPKGFPKVARKFFKKTLVCYSTMDWILDDGEVKECFFKMSFEGIPCEVNGEMVLRPHGHGCEHKTTTMVVVKVPVVGKIMASLLAEDVKKSYIRIYEFNVVFLENY